jgi:HSP20 family protein
MGKHSTTTFGVPVKSPDSIWQPLKRARNEFDSLFDEFWARPMGIDFTRRLQAITGPAIELTEKEDAFELVAEIPGMKAEDVEVNLSEGMLRLSGERQESHEDKSKGFVFSERSYGRFERTIQLPQGVDYDKISAKAENGILTIQLPKNPAAIERERKIPITA